MSKFFLIPKVDTRLVLYVELHRNISKEGANALLFRLLRLGSQILCVEIDNVDILDSVFK